MGAACSTRSIRPIEKTIQYAEAEVEESARFTTLAELVIGRGTGSAADRMAYTFLGDKGEVKQALTYGQLLGRAKTVAAKLQQVRTQGKGALLLGLVRHEVTYDLVRCALRASGCSCFTHRGSTSSPRFSVRMLLGIARSLYDSTRPARGTLYDRCTLNDRLPTSRRRGGAHLPSRPDQAAPRPAKTRRQALEPLTGISHRCLIAVFETGS
jgi:hypothetical protein